MLNLSDFDYQLPAGRIAQFPAAPRDACRLLVLDRASGRLEHGVFRDLGNYLSPADLLILNNTRVMPARLFGKKDSGGKAELLLLREVGKNLWECLVRPGRRLRSGVSIGLNGNGLRARIKSREKNGTRLVKFEGAEDVRSRLAEIGEIPFPPYVTGRCFNPEEYQTVYAKPEGSVAAPTAGLHFTEDLLASLRAQGVSTAELSLHVGWGTFRPVRCEKISEHVMEKEWYSVPPAAAQILNEAETSGKRIVAVGTTACRVLESLPPGPVTPSSGWINLFIYPGFAFRRTGALLTNFHLPKSTLLMLVCAFAGRDLIFKAYAEAVEKSYRFCSFGDAMLIL